MNSFLLITGKKIRQTLDDPSVCQLNCYYRCGYPGKGQELATTTPLEEARDEALEEALE